MENPNEKFYGIMNAELSLPSKDLLIVPHRNGKLIVNYPAFGPNPYLINIKLMSKKYFHSKRLPNVSFVDPTTSESISIAAYDFEKQTYKQFFNGRWLQLGLVVKTLEGVFVNPQKVLQSDEIYNEKNLKLALKCTRKINGIYLGVKDFGFAPFETFNHGEQDIDTFSRSGLARILEHTGEMYAENIRTIGSSTFYNGGVQIVGYDDPLSLKVAGFSLGDRMDDLKLIIGGFGLENFGFAYGVLNKEIQY